MKAPAMKLLKQEKMIRANSPGTARTTPSVPRRSTPRAPPSDPVASTSGSGIRTPARCRNDTTETAMPSTSAERMPSKATSRPLITEVTSGLLVAFDGMRSALVLGMAVSVVSFLHLAGVRIPEPEVLATGSDGGARGVDLRGTLGVVRAVPGLFALIIFSCFNNFIAGAFMALMDPYGLSLMSVQAWGLLWGVLSGGVIVGGLLVARTGVGPSPVRTLLLVNIVLWAGCV